MKLLITIPGGKRISTNNLTDIYIKYLNIYIFLFHTEWMKSCHEMKQETIHPYISDRNGYFVSNYANFNIFNHKLSPIFLNIPIQKGDILKLQLEKNYIFSDHGLLEWTDNDTVVRDHIPEEENCFYQGHVVGQEGSNVALSLCGDILVGTPLCFKVY